MSHTKEIHAHPESGASAWVDEAIDAVEHTVHRGDISLSDTDALNVFIDEQVEHALADVDAADRAYFLNAAVEAMYPMGDTSPETLSGKLGGSTERGRVAVRVLRRLTELLEQSSDDVEVDMQPFLHQLIDAARGKVAIALDEEGSTKAKETRAVPKLFGSGR